MRWTAMAAAVAALAACSSDGTGPAKPKVNCVPSATEQLAVPVGGVHVVSGATSLACVTLAGAGGPSEYVFVVANADPKPDVVAQYSVTATSAPIVTAAALAARNAVEVPPFETSVEVPAQEVLERHVRATERLTLRPSAWT